MSATPQPLLLMGTETSGAPRTWLARLGTDRRNPQTYRVGSLLASGARIQSIAADHVILERDGRTMRIDLEPAGRATDADRVVRAGAMDVVGGPPAKVEPLAPSREAVTAHVRPQPVYDEAGQFVAYELRPAGRSNGLFDALGLAAGDRLIEANGAPITTAAQGAQVLEALAAGAVMPVTVIRNGQRVDLQLDGQAFSAARTAAAPGSPIALQ